MARMIDSDRLLRELTALSHGQVWPGWTYDGIRLLIERQPTLTQPNEGAKDKNVPTNEPLTLEELSLFNAPVWIRRIGDEDLSGDGWAIVEGPRCLTWHNRIPVSWEIRVRWPGSEVEDYPKYENYGKTWLAYAYPPAHIDREAWEPCKLCNQFGEIDPCYKDGCFRKNAPKCCYMCDKFLQWRKVEKKLKDAKFCPECGRPLTEESWEELEKRVRGEK